jgi:hypothetical protein
MSTFKRLSRFDFEIREIDQQERIAIDRNVISH